MAFFQLLQDQNEQTIKGGISLDLLHRQQCNVCPLNRQSSLRHPHMEPTGSAKPLVYILGEAPGRDEDFKGVQFVGRTGSFLRRNIPPKMEQHIRWNNCVRTRPPDNRTPSAVEIECCRPSVEADIEQSRPKAIFGFGNVPLDWALKQSYITKWSGRRIPIKVRSHSCWFYPMMHPSYIMRNEYNSSDMEFVFKMHLHNAFAEVENLPEPEVHSKDDALANVDYVIGNHGDLDIVLDFLDKAADEKVIGFDYETSCLRPYEKDARILSVAISCSDQTLAFPIGHKEAKWSNEDLTLLETHLEDFLHKAPCRKAAHHLAFEQEWSGYFFGPECLHNSKWGDSLSQAYILDERPDMHNLGILCLQYFGINIKNLFEMDRKNLDEEPLEQVLLYNGVDAKYHRALYIEQGKRLREEGLVEVYARHMRRVPTMVLTQLKGVPTDNKVVSKFYDRYQTKLEDIENDIAELKVAKQFRKLKGKEFRPSALQDMGFVLKNLLKIDYENLTESTLTKVDHPIAKLTLRWRKTNKLLSTYIKPLMTDSGHVYSDGLLHPIISTTRTRTWRTSADSPNIQNFPKREESSKEVRSQIRPGPGKKIVAFDFAGIQARNVAMESNDKKLVDAFWHHYDIHSDWRDRLAKHYPQWAKGKTSKDDLKALRHLAKNKFVFPSFFGARPKSISANLKIPEDVIADVQAEFFSEFKDIKNWHERILDEYRKTGYVTGLSGFRRRAPISQNELINAPIQADESLIVCDAMYRLSKLDDERFQANLEVHDDLTFFWDEKEVDENIDVVVREMLWIGYEWINVPLEVEVSIGDDWAHLEEIAKFESVGVDGYKELK